MLVAWVDVDRIAEQGDDIELHLDERMARAASACSSSFTGLSPRPHRRRWTVR